MIVQRLLAPWLCLVTLSLATAFSAADAAPIQANDTLPSFKAIEQNIEKAMEIFAVPGVAVAIVKDDKLVFAKGFGVREMGKKDKVNAQTLFGIASNTKAFTTTALAMLVEEGKLDWNDKVIDHIPGFQLYDAYVTGEFTIADMLSHRSGLGLGGGDLMIWPTTDISNAEIIKRMRYIKPASSFRAKYAYNNLMYVLAGEVVANVSGMPWQDFIAQRILKPLRMDSTRMAYSLIESNNHNVARPHGPVDGVLKPVGGNFLEKFSSAGSIASNVNDMSQWLMLQLNRGLISSHNGEEQRLFAQAQSYKLWQPQQIQSVSAFIEEHHKTQFRAYALGWGINDYHGYKMVGHTGGIMGMVSKVVMVPEAKLGLVILTNQQSGSAFNAIAYDIVNRFLGLENKDWVGLYDKKRKTKQASQNNAVIELMDGRDKASKPSLPLEQYAQVYHDDWYGDIEVKLINQGRKDEKLEMRFSRTKVLVGALEHFQHNTFIVRWYDRSTDADAFVHFALTPQGKIEQATMKAVSEGTDFSFDFHHLTLQPKVIE